MMVVKGMIIKVRKQRGGKGDITYYVRIPKHIYEALGAPEAFKLTLENGKIVLTPLKET